MDWADGLVGLVILTLYAAWLVGAAAGQARERALKKLRQARGERDYWFNAYMDAVLKK